MQKKSLSELPPRWLLCVILIIVLIKLGIWVVAAQSGPFHYISARDTLTYQNPARALVQTGRFAVSPDHPEIPETLRTPGYPALIAAVYSFYGDQDCIIVLVQVFLSLSTLGLVYLMGRQLGGHKLGIYSVGDIQRLAPQEYIQKWICQSPVYFTGFVLAMLYLFLVYAGIGLWGIDRLKNRRFSSTDAFLWGVLLYLVVVSAGPEAYFRFRAPLMPVLVLYSVQGWLHAI